MFDINKALGKFPISRVFPMAYAAYSCFAVLSSVIVFGELSSFLEFIYFVLVFGLAMFVIMNGVQMIQSVEGTHGELESSQKEK